MGAPKATSFPCSLRSLFHGLSLFFAIAVVVACWAGLWQISQHQSYAGNHNECFVTNSAAFYNGDNVLYCPNAHVVSSISLLDFNHLVWAETISGVNSWKDLETVGMQEGFNYTADIYIDDDDQNCWWYFNMNPGSSVDMTFKDITGSGLQVQVDDEEWVELDPTVGSQLFTFTTTVEDEPRGYKVEVYATNATMKGTYQGEVMFQYDQTYYTDPPGVGDISRFQCTDAPRSNCTWELDWDTDICISMWYPGEHYYGNNWDGQCVEVNQLGRPKWSAVLVPTTAMLLAIIVIGNVIVCVAAEKLQRRHSLEEPYMEAMDTITSGDEVFDYSARRDAHHEHSGDESW